MDETKTGETTTDETKTISETFKRHYAEKIRTFGPTAKGLDWGAETDVLLRYDKMLEVILQQDLGRRPSLLDVGCGYGGLLAHARASGIDLAYTGIDQVEETIAHGRTLFPQDRFVVGDVLAWEPGDETFDYVVCSGILTLKLTASIQDMHKYFQALCRKMFALSRKGFAFNVMTNCVNFTVDNLYYRSPVEVLAFCLSEFSNKVRLDQSYPLYEFTTYLYRAER